MSGKTMNETNEIQYRKLKGVVNALRSAGVDPAEYLEKLRKDRAVLTDGENRILVNGTVVNALLTGENPFSAIEKKRVLKMIDESLLSEYADLYKQLSEIQSRIAEVQSRLNLPSGWKLVRTASGFDLVKARRGSSGPRRRWEPSDFPREAKFKNHRIVFKYDPASEEPVRVEVDGSLVGNFPNVTAASLAALKAAGASPGTRRNFREWTKKVS